MAFSYGARSVFKLKKKNYLRSMLSRRQLQGFVMLRCSVSRVPLQSNAIRNSRR